MKFLAIEQENVGVSPSDYPPLLKTEAESVWKLYQSDFIREIYYDKNKSAAVLILECSSQKEVSDILSELPLVKNGIIKFDIYHLGPYHGFARLM
jgi:hypothetical protein